MGIPRCSKSERERERDWEGRWEWCGEAAGIEGRRQDLSNVFHIPSYNFIYLHILSYTPKYFHRLPLYVHIRQNLHDRLSHWYLLIYLKILVKFSFEDFCCGDHTPIDRGVLPFSVSAISSSLYILSANERLSKSTWRPLSIPQAFAQAFHQAFTQGLKKALFSCTCGD